MTEPRHSQPKPLHFLGLAERLGVDLNAAVAEAQTATGQRYLSHAELADRRGWKDRDVCSGQLVVLDRDDRVWVVRCDVCGWEGGLPEREADPKARASWLVDRAGLPERFLSKQFEKTSAANEFTRRSLWSWIASERLAPAPALFGLPGRGKTHLFVFVLRELVVRRQKPVLFRTAPQLLSDLQAAMNTPGYDEQWRQLVSTPLLALDDLGAEMDTDWRTDRIAALVDERYRADLPLAVTTNIAPDRWDDAFDGRTASRLREMTFPLELVGDDRRVNDGKQLALVGAPAVSQLEGKD
jgi:hypothetical protein